MKAVKLKTSLLIGSIVHSKDEVVMVTDQRAAELIKLDHAEAVEGTPEVANPGQNPLADVIEPQPPGGLVLNPADAAAPNVNDNPGVKKAVEVGGLKVKDAKLKPEAVKEGPVEPVKVDPAATANEVVPK